MEQQFKELAWKCYQNHLRFEYIPASNGVTICTEDYKLVSMGYLDNKMALYRIDTEVDNYLKEELSDERNAG